MCFRGSKLHENLCSLMVNKPSAVCAVKSEQRDRFARVHTSGIPERAPRKVRRERVLSI